MNSAEKILLIILIIPTVLFSQWSTSPYTQDALWACPGFYSDIVTYPDGSSIIIGIGDGNEIWMQKLDPYGYKQWLPYVTVFPAMSGVRFFLPDDAGGVYAIVGTQAQRIDKNGNLCLGTNGKKIIPSGSLTNAITDGKNGFIALYNRYDGLQQRVSLLRFDSTGTNLWERQIDSSNVQNSLEAKIVGRLSEKTLLYSSKAKDKFVDLSGNVSIADSNYLRSDIFINDNDSIGYFVKFLSTMVDSQGYKIYEDRVIRLSKNWDTVWTVLIQFMDTKGAKQYLNVGTPFLADKVEGLFFVSSHIDSSDLYHTRIQRITRNGFVFSGEGIIIDDLAGRFFFTAKAKVGFITDYANAQLIDTSGKLFWSDRFSIISDPFDAYVKHVASDNNGGAIISFWTVAGGIKVQHTGRIGKVGILTKILEEKITPLTFELYQNFPNPFNSSTTIVFSLSENSEVELKIFDMLGREIQQIVKDKLESGKYSVRVMLDKASSGTYFSRLSNGKNILSRKMQLIK